jgi:hypothetical protein
MASGLQITAAVKDAVHNVLDSGFGLHNSYHPSIQAVEVQ